MCRGCPSWTATRHSSTRNSVCRCIVTFCCETEEEEGKVLVAVRRRTASASSIAARCPFSPSPSPSSPSSPSFLASQSSPTTRRRPLLGGRRRRPTTTCSPSSTPTLPSAPTEIKHWKLFSLSHLHYVPQIEMYLKKGGGICSLRNESSL